MISGSPQVRFDVVARANADAGERTIVSFTHQYTQDATQFADVLPPTGPLDVGDLLTLRISVVGGAPGSFYMPNGESAPTPTARLLTLDIP